MLGEAETECMRIQTRNAKTHSHEGISECHSDFVLDDAISFCISLRRDAPLRDRE